MALLDAGEPVDTFAEKLGGWIHFADAITLSAVHAGTPGAAAARTTATAGSAARLNAELERVQSALTASILNSFSPKSGKSHNKLPAALPDLPLVPATACTPYRRFYSAHQRDMELGIQPLRVNAREAVAKASPRLRKLAELDATFDRILRERESKLLSRIPLLLGRRFEQLFRRHEQALADAGQTDNPATWMQADGWLAQFCGDMQTLLLAELELRLQPAMGLIDALNQDTQ